MSAFFIVRAEVQEEDRAAFDRWYQTEHMPDAMRAFQPTKARRGWSDIDPTVHIAVYEFENLDRARVLVGGDASDEIRAMIAEFDRVWGDRVTRTRELLGISQTL